MSPVWRVVAGRVDVGNLSADEVLQDICVDNIRFVIPDDTDTSTDGRRRFSVEVSANYIDVVSSDNCCSDK